MSEIQSVKWLRALLGVHLNWHGARLEFLARFILALLQVRTVNLARLAVVFSSRAKVSSNYIRLQRFMREFVIDQAEIAQVVAALLPKDLPWILTLDRTNWKLGSVEINFLVLGVVYQGLAIPLFWTVLPKAGNSSTPERQALLERYWKTFRGQPVAYLLGDREFIGQEWLVYLRQRDLPFRLRIKHNHTLVSKRGESYPLLREFRRLAIGQTRLLRRPRRLWGLEVFLSAKRLGQDEWLILVSDTYSAHSLEDYAQRWSIEIYHSWCLHTALIRRGSSARPRRRGAVGVPSDAGRGAGRVGVRVRWRRPRSTTGVDQRTRRGGPSANHGAAN